MMYMKLKHRKQCIWTWLAHVGATFKTKGNTLTQEVNALVCVNKGSIYPEIAGAKLKQTKYTSELFDEEWLCRYPRHKKVAHDNGEEFTEFEFQEMIISYGIKTQPTTVKNPQKNVVAETMYLPMGDIVRMTVFEGAYWFKEIYELQYIAWAIRSTINTTVGYTPGHMALEEI